jgi:pimeloyl-ACP methyl ester carboxylesterase
VSHNDCVIVVLLPGADGTAELFEGFIKELPTNVQVVTIKYPTEATLDYEQLAELAFDELPREKPYIIIAESYSGPVAIALATRPAGDLRAIVLVASFVARPLGLLGLLFARLPLTTVLRIRPPLWILRWLLMESATPPELVADVLKAILKVQPKVLASRIREALTVDRTDAASKCPVRVVCVAAERDRLLKSTVTRALPGYFPHAETMTKRGPHLLLQCAPATVRAALSELGLFNDT